MAHGKGKMTFQPLQMKGSGIVTADAILAEQKPLPEDHPFYQLIGRVVAEWARFEHILDQIIWDLAKGQQDINSCITGQIMGHHGRIKAIVTLAVYRGHTKASIGQINALKNDTFKLVEERNRFLHDAWFVQEALNITSKVGQFKSLSATNKKFGFSTITEEEILKTINGIKDISERAANLRSILVPQP